MYLGLNVYTIIAVMRSNDMFRTTLALSGSPITIMDISPTLSPQIYAPSDSSHALLRDLKRDCERQRRARARNSAASPQSFCDQGVLLLLKPVPGEVDKVEICN